MKGDVKEVKEEYVARCSANSSLFAYKSQIDLLQIYLLIFRSLIDSYSFLLYFQFVSIIPIPINYNFTNIIPIGKYFSKYSLILSNSRFPRMWMTLYSGCCSFVCSVV